MLNWVCKTNLFFLLLSITRTGCTIFEWLPRNFALTCTIKYKSEWQEILSSIVYVINAQCKPYIRWMYFLPVRSSQQNLNAASETGRVEQHHDEDGQLAASLHLCMNSSTPREAPWQVGNIPRRAHMVCVVSLRSSMCPCSPALSSACCCLWLRQRAAAAVPWAVRAAALQVHTGGRRVLQEIAVFADGRSPEDAATAGQIYICSLVLFAGLLQEMIECWCSTARLHTHAWTNVMLNV